MRNKTFGKGLLMIVFFFGLTAFNTANITSSELGTEQMNAKRITDPCVMSNNAFKVGEELTYTIYWNWGFVWYSAGEVTLKVKDNGSEFHIDVDGKTFKKHDWIFKVRDEYDTYINKKSLLPREGVRKVKEGGYRLYDKVTFDQNNKKVASLRGKNASDATLSNYDVDGCMHDILSILYYLRNINYDRYQSGDKFPIEIFMDKEVWPLDIGYYGKKKNVKVKGWDDKFDTVVFGPEVIEGYIFKESDKMKVYASDDKNKIPLMIESPISVGSVKVVLKSHKNLRHPFVGE